MKWITQKILLAFLLLRELTSHILRSLGFLGTPTTIDLVSPVTPGNLNEVIGPLSWRGMKVIVDPRIPEDQAFFLRRSRSLILAPATIAEIERLLPTSHDFTALSVGWRPTRTEPERTLTDEDLRILRKTITEAAKEILQQCVLFSIQDGGTEGNQAKDDAVQRRGGPQCRIDEDRFVDDAE